MVQFHSQWQQLRMAFLQSSWLRHPVLAYFLICFHLQPERKHEIQVLLLLLHILPHIHFNITHIQPMSWLNQQSNYNQNCLHQEQLHFIQDLQLKLLLFLYLHKLVYFRLIKLASFFLVQLLPQSNRPFSFFISCNYKLLIFLQFK